MPENKKFWKFCNQAGNKVELLLYGDISQTSWWGDEVTPKQFAEATNSGAETRRRFRALARLLWKDSLIKAIAR